MRNVPFQPEISPAGETVSRTAEGSGVAMSRPRLLDLYCCAGGAAKGYQRAGFYVVGVDIEPQPRYCGDEFIQADALEALADREFVSSFDAGHGSPPCQDHSALNPWLKDNGTGHLLAATRRLLSQSGLPWVIENVDGSGLAAQEDLFGANGLLLCGSMFGLPLYRHRLFESSLPLAAPHHPRHLVPASKAGHWVPGTIISVAGNCAPIAMAREAMGIGWMNRDELAESIPPAFTEFIGAQLLRSIERAA